MRQYFFLDFDGVVCDSIPECFVSSYRAYHELYLGETVEAIPLRDKTLFYKYRPFIRAGEDYPLIQDIIRRGVSVDSQEAFDAEIARAGGYTMKHYGQLFYKVREDFLVGNKEFWLDLNPLFPGMAGVLSRAAGSKNFYILSTKKALFIKEILTHHGMDWDLPRILYTGDKTKRQIIESFMGVDGRAVLVDDQLDHLLVAAGNKNIDCRLAVWGYVKQPWLEQKDIPLIGEDGLLALVSAFLG
jgi:hypothetical protein